MLLSVVYSIAAAFLVGCGRDLPVLGTLPEFSLTAVTADGTSPFDRSAMAGRAWVADFVFTRCMGPCPMLTANMARLQKQLPAGAGLLSFTVDPDHDSPEVLTLYARKFGADSQRWFFVTGEKPALMKLYRDGFRIPVREDAKARPGENVAHTTKFVLVDGQGRIRGYYDGDDDEALKKLARDARRL